MTASSPAMGLILLAAVALTLAGGARAAAQDGSREAAAPPAAVSFTDGALADPDRGNPLWAVPVEALSATRERPLFTPSRRPPVTPLATPPAAAAPPPAPPPPARPRLTLIGTVVSPVDSFGIFLDPASSKVLRLRTGEVHEGWTLRVVSLRDVTLRSSAGSATLTLPVRAASDTAPGPGRGVDGQAMAGRPAGQMPTAHNIIVPRRAPKSPLEDYPDH